MPINKAWMFTCGRCGITDTFYSEDMRLRQRQAEADARDIGWQDVYDDWYCKGCTPIIKREKRAEATGYNAHSRVDAINNYRIYLLDHPKLLACVVPELRDKTLGCWCAPAGGLDGNIAGYLCHGQILAALADDPAPQQTLAQFIRALKHRDDYYLSEGAPVAAMEQGQPPNTCPVCGAKMERERQVGRCVYAEPCGHRLYQGKTRKMLEREWQRRESIRRCGTELASHVHQWQPWGADVRYEHCLCGASRKAEAVS